MLYELKYVWDTFLSHQSCRASEAYKTKEQAEERSNKLKLFLKARNIEIIEHKKAKNYIIDGDGHRQYPNDWLD